MKLAKLVKLTKSSKWALGQTPLKKHRNNHPADFELLISRGDWLVRYYNDFESVCIGEFVLDTLKRNGEWLFVHPFDDESIYAVHVKDGFVQKEIIDSLSQVVEIFEFEFHENIQVLINSDELSLSDEIKVERTQINFNIPEKYKLKEPSTSKNTYLGLGAAALVILFFSGQALFSPPPPPPVQIDPWQEWESEYLSRTPADKALENAAYLSVYQYLLPDDWMAEPIILEGNNVVLRIKPVKDGMAKFGTLKAFANKYSELEKYFVNDKTISLPVKFKEKPERYYLGNYPKKLHDSFITLGATTVTLEEIGLSDIVIQKKLSATFTNVPMSMLARLSETVAGQPVFLTKLTVTPDSEHHVTIDIEMLLDGVK